ncbi:peptidoglycan D,D-transpeptidase FtsI family protein [Vagococcus xieshaowenii]|uniref:Penicillin-binding protein 2 n=1 Tax=Vagococcus xieshaowenii TaxID=2562451 RepID=A0AAJ5EFI6_9ENTE|nr:penicillin-binding protein 2 [Vagococcus xieshaowenii]QCA28220.1 penicillin-binding protein 2 [Vagococcus xieshaowenii]TFZ41875.1 penicillin-binding protein 2 [Vagococcus xieshaowenii]
MKKINKLSSEALNKKLASIPFRLNVLFFIVFGLFVALIGQLAYLQIFNKDYFVDRITSGEMNIVEGQAPRGMIYDANGKALVSNKAKSAIMFTKGKNMTAEQILEAVYQINDIITVTPDKLSERDKKDFWLASEENLKTARERFTKKEQEAAKKMSNAEEYQLVVDKVTKEDLNFNERQLSAASIFKRINAAYALQPIFIKNEGVTKEEVALVGENRTKIPGLSTGYDWEREYPENGMLRTVLGTISTDKSGLPDSSLDSYLAKGYSLNDRVGVSYIEKAYESVLKGSKSRSEVKLDENNEITDQREVFAGQKGENLMLTIDIDFQNKVEDIVESEYKRVMSEGKATYSEGAYAVAINPQTGEVLSMVGFQQDDKGQLQDDTLGTINKAFVPGSSIKGATIMAGYQNDVLQPNETLIDEPLRFIDGTIKASLFNPASYGGQVPINSEDALMVSSNVYMMKIALRLMGTEYTNKMSLPERTDVFETLRKTYREFGLGTETGIDIPGESSWLSPTNYYDDNGNLLYGRMGNLLDLSFGNFDTYTTMQLAQYVSTIANGGYRIAPRLVKGIYNNDEAGGLGTLEQQFKPTILNEIRDKDDLDIIQQGFYNVVNSTDARRTGSRLQSSKYTVAAKTGTAETPIVDPDNSDNVISLNSYTVVAYNYEENPDIAVAVMLPHMKEDKTGTNLTIAGKILDAYYEKTR